MSHTVEKPEFSDVHRLQNALLEGFHRAVNHKANKSLCNRLVNQISVQMNPIQSHNWTFDFQESSVCYYLFLQNTSSSLSKQIETIFWA